MKCILCGKRKGKRFCPAKNTQICPQCCGEKRVVEIDCPSDCVYLHSGQTYQSVKKYTAQLRQQEDPARVRKFYQTTQQFGPVLVEIEKAIIRYAADLTTLDDEQTLAAIELLKDTYRTESKGVIYEHTSPNPLIQALARTVRESVETARTQRQTESPPPTIDDLVDCLVVVENDIRFHLERGDEGESYLNFIKRNHPKTVSKTSSRPNLIQT